MPFSHVRDIILPVNLQGDKKLAFKSSSYEEEFILGLLEKDLEMLCRKPLRTTVEEETTAAASGEVDALVSAADALVSAADTYEVGSSEDVEMQDVETRDGVTSSLKALYTSLSVLYPLFTLIRRYFYLKPKDYSSEILTSIQQVLMSAEEW